MLSLCSVRKIKIHLIVTSVVSQAGKPNYRHPDFGGARQRGGRFDVAGIFIPARIVKSDQGIAAKRKYDLLENCGGCLRESSLLGCFTSDMEDDFFLTTNARSSIAID
jgi:hypothetical protein